ncbi:16S rRNA pseudouridine(516) synthase [Thalassotalea euphylliae]|uniref:Pseudouridine synthase n=1 Tax=Thalassotalea euphylliae TaxID=1655234 RepID=A0A3E0TTW4_9GAMM|nr:16S rRNA pseudouridine(516) synthase [Thalassotalea euphylliae]REL27797.1 16S rRNA pseudouridine(516) synthase [Thalassotalea euphylliae]
MSLSTSRIDKFIAQHLNIARKQVRVIIAQQRVVVDDIVVTHVDQQINKFSVIALDGKVIQRETAHYLMLHKPVGVVCATTDKQHKTVIDLIDESFKKQLHIVGRLDLNTSGLVLLTNDSRWSEALTDPKHKVEKHYQVTLANKLTPEYITAFADGMYFGCEDITTQPARLTILDDYRAHVVLTEGKYHQIKRMFGRFRNPVLALHRSRIGSFELPDSLLPGQYKALDIS